MFTIFGIYSQYYKSNDQIFNQFDWISFAGKFHEEKDWCTTVIWINWIEEKKREKPNLVRLQSFSINLDYLLLLLETCVTLMNLNLGRRRKVESFNNKNCTSGKKCSQIKPLFAMYWGVLSTITKQIFHIQRGGALQHGHVK